MEAGDFSEIYETCYGRVHAYISRRVGATLADDLTAETFMVAWRRIDAMPEPALPWLYGVARNIVLRERTRLARRTITREALRAQARPIETADAGDDESLWSAWEQLSPSDQEVLALIAWEELPVRDAARAMRCSAPVFSVRLHRARKRFERLLGRPDPPSKPIPHLREAS